MAVQSSVVYSIHANATISTAITMLQVKAGAAKPLAVLRAWCSQAGSTTSIQAGIEIVRKSGAATVTAATTANLGTFNPSIATSALSLSLGTSATGYTATAEGTDGDVLYDDSLNSLGSWLWQASESERIVVPAAGFIALKFSAAPTASATWRFGMVVEEIG